jgi:hypothetical protein
LRQHPRSTVLTRDFVQVVYPVSGSFSFDEINVDHVVF